MKDCEASDTECLQDNAEILADIKDLIFDDDKK